MKAICFDIEATDRGEMLELSMFSYPEKKEAYHSYYKPVKSKEWKTTEAIHHITPAMVADAPRFASERSKVQELIDACELIVGFAIDNDLRYLRGAGVNIPEKKPVLDVRDLVYMVKGKECDLRYGTVPSLSKCAQMAGLDFTEESDAHSATNDTLATLDLLDALLQASGHKLDARLLNDLDACLEEAREEQLRLSARGVLRLVPAPAASTRSRTTTWTRTRPRWPTASWPYRSTAATWPSTSCEQCSTSARTRGGLCTTSCARLTSTVFSATRMSTTPSRSSSTATSTGRGGIATTWISMSSEQASR